MQQFFEKPQTLTFRYCLFCTLVSIRATIQHVGFNNKQAMGVRRGEDIMGRMILDNAVLRLAMLALVTFGVSACASVPSDPEDRAAYEENNDPLEPFNRNVFAFNQFLDSYLFKPAAQAYRYVLPEPVRMRVGNVLNNLGEPVNAANNLLQGDAVGAGDSVARFVMNSTVGLAGVHDVATEMGAPEQAADFGQTLHTWGVGEGPYLVLPIFGPSNPRDFAGIIGDMTMDPWRYAANNQLHNDESFTFSATRYTLTVLDRRERSLDVLDALERDSFDFYAQMRSLYKQRRAKQLAGADVQTPAYASPAVTSN